MRATSKAIWVERSTLAALWPGLGLVIVVSLVARLTAMLLPFSVSEIVVGVLLGLGVAAFVGLPTGLVPGARFASDKVLRVGIVLLGAQLSLSQLVSTGLGGLVVIVTVVALAAAGMWLACSRLKVSLRLATLLAIGTAICGNSAIVATAPVVKADENEIGIAMATITLFGMAALLLYPVIGAWLQMDHAMFGYWAGAAVNDTSQATATGFAFSQTSGEIATVVKLTRNALMGPMIVVIGATYARSGIAGSESSPSPRRGVGHLVPAFIVGFVLLAIFNSLGWIPPVVAGAMDGLARAFILMALVGIGLRTNLGQLRRVGLGPLYAGLLISALVSAGALGMVTIVSP